MKRNQIVTGKVIDTAFPSTGKVLIDDSDRIAAVKGVLPGQRIELRLTRTSVDNTRGELKGIIEHAPYEKEAGCPHFSYVGEDGDRCGGCLYQTISYEKELEIKEHQITSLFEKIVPDFGRVFEGITGSEEKGYRNKMEFTFGDRVKDGPLELGMHRKGSFYDIVSTPGCTICHEDFGAILKATLDFFKGVPYYHKITHGGYLRHLLVRRAHFTGQIIVDLVTADYDGDDEETLLSDYARLLQGLDLEGTLVGVLHTRNNSVSDTVKDEGTEVLYGSDHFFEKLLGLSFRITPFSFFQTNSEGAEKLYGKAGEYLLNALHGEKPDEVFDLYSGTGTIAQVISPYAKHVTGVEIVPEAVGAAKENAALNQITNCDFICNDVFKALDDLKTLPDYIIVDPPREGLQPKAITKILSYQVPAVIYIACKPSSLARDIPAFIHAGYDVKRMAAVDMFPRTGNTEVIALLGRKMPD